MKNSTLIATILFANSDMNEIIERGEKLIMKECIIQAKRFCMVVVEQE